MKKYGKSLNAKRTWTLTQNLTRRFERSVIEADSIVLYRSLLLVLRARSRLYRNEILQVNMRLKALAEIYTMHSFDQLCNLNFWGQFFA